MKYVLLLILTFAASGLLAQNANQASKEKLIIATKDSPPFAFKDETGEWTGISIDLWEGVAREMKWDFEYKEYDLPGLLNAVAKGDADIGVSAISVTAERAQDMDFTPTYFSSALGIATSYRKSGIWTIIIDRVFTAEFASAIFVLIVVLMAAAFFVWVFERKHNPEHFGGDTKTGLGSAFWWSAVTMTTVGYGDKAPVTLGGRLVGLVWMFTSIIIISGLTGAIATALTVGQLTPRVTGPQDLHRVAVGAIEDSVADAYLRQRGLRPSYYKDVATGLQAVKDNEIEAFVNDQAILAYWAGKSFAGEVDVLPNSFDPSYIAFATPLNSPLERELNLALLEYVQTGAWDSVLAKYRATP